MKFSIITCTFNSEKFLLDNINSVKIQGFLDYEHIFIDGFSSDKTMQIIENYKNENPESVKIFQLSPRGISNAMNEGIKRATGDYIIHLHADDFFVDNSVLRDVNCFLSKYNYDWIYGKINVINADTGLLGIFPAKKIYQNINSKFASFLLKFYNYIPHQSVFIKKAVFEHFGGFDEGLTSAMDPDLWLRIAGFTKWSFFDRLISNLRVHSLSQSSGLSFRIENQKNWRFVQQRYLNKLELIVASVINFLVKFKNKTYS